MADIRKRQGKKGTSYQVRYPSKYTKSGYAFKVFKTLKEARAFREDSQARLTERSRHVSVKTVNGGLEKWLEVCEKEGRHGRDPVTKYTLQTYSRRKEIIEQYNWDLELHELTAPDVVEFKSWLLRNYSRDLSRKVLSSFHSMILEMISRGIMNHDIAAGVCIRSNSRYDTSVKIPTEAEVNELLNAADRLANSKNAQVQRTWERYRPMLYLATDSGMRPQEYVALPRSNVKKTGVQVDQAVERGGYKISVTKTPAGRRFIDLSPETLDMIRYYVKHHAAKSNYDLVFPTASGKWQSTDNWRKRGFYAACYEAGLINVVIDENGKQTEKPKYKPYDLRHFFASMLIEQNTNLKRIQKLMGHEDIQTTLNVYGHLIEKAETAGDENTGLLSSMRKKP